MDDPIDLMLTGDRESIRRAMSDVYHWDDAESTDARRIPAQPAIVNGAAKDETTALVPASRIRFATLLIVAFCLPIAVSQISSALAATSDKEQLLAIYEQVPEFFELVEDDADFIGTAFQLLQQLNSISADATENVSIKAYLTLKIATVIALHNSKRGSVDEAQRWLQNANAALTEIRDTDDFQRATAILNYSKARFLYEAALEQRVDDPDAYFMQAIDLARASSNLSLPTSDFRWIYKSRLALLAATALLRCQDLDASRDLFKESKEYLDRVEDQTTPAYLLAFGRWSANYGLILSRYAQFEPGLADRIYSEAIERLNARPGGIFRYMLGVLHANRADLMRQELKLRLTNNGAQMTPEIRSLAEREIADRLEVRAILESGRELSSNSKTNYLINESRLAQVYLVAGELTAAIESVNRVADMVPDLLTQTTPQLTTPARVSLVLLATLRTGVEPEAAAIEARRVLLYLEKLTVGPEGEIALHDLPYLIFLARLEANWSDELRELLSRKYPEEMKKAASQPML